MAAPLIGKVEQPVAAGGLVALHQHIGPFARGQQQLLKGFRGADGATIGGDPYQPMPFQDQAVDAGIGGIEQSQPQLPLAIDRPGLSSPFTVSTGPSRPSISPMPRLASF